MYTYLINQTRGPYWENVGLRSWQYTPDVEARSVQKRPRVDIPLLRFWASLFNKRFITELKMSRKKSHYHGVERNWKLHMHSSDWKPTFWCFQMFSKKKDKKVERKRKTVFYAWIRSFSKVNHKSTRKSFRVIARDHRDHWQWMLTHWKHESLCP